MHSKVNRRASGSTRNQRKTLLKSKRLKKVANSKRKSWINRLKLHKDKRMAAKGSIEDIFQEYESTEVEKDSDTDECIFIAKKQRVIVIDDDEDDNVNKSETSKPTTEEENSDTDEVILIDSQITENTSDLHEAEPNTPKKTESSQSKTSSPERNLINQKDLSQLKALSPSRKFSKIAQSDLFYKDTTPALDAIKTPLYEIVKPDDSVILIDGLSETTKKESILENIDDSVIFVSEEVLLGGVHPNQEALDYIPLSDSNDGVEVTPLKRKTTHVLDRVIQPFKKFKNQLSFLYQNTSTPKEPKKSDLLTRSEKKKNQQYNSNVYNPNKEEKKTGKRMVIIDGSNVAFGHSLNKEFSVKGLEICIDYFVNKGHEVKAVVPQFRLQKFKSSNPERLEAMHKEGKIVFTPCKNLPGKSATSYDDRFILQLADEFDAAVVSNDNYRDLLGENPAFKKIVETRVIGYTWCKDMFLLPKDPYGRLGPTLSVILNH